MATLIFPILSELSAFESIFYTSAQVFCAILAFFRSLKDQ